MNARTRQRLLAAVRRGARLLDKTVHSWHRKVPITRLDMARYIVSEYGDGCGCVLAHTHGDYRTGRAAIGIGQGEAERHGFDIGRDTDWSYEDLTLAWKDEIRARRAKTVAA